MTTFNSTTYRYYSSLVPLSKILRYVVLGGFLTAIFAFSVGWYEAGVISYEELAAAIVLPLVAWALGALALRVIVRMSPVDVSPNGLRCYDLRGKFHSVPWHDIESTTFEVRGDLPYVFVRAKNLKSPLTLPLFLQGMHEFVGYVSQYAGEKHPLTVALRNAP